MIEKLKKKGKKNSFVVKSFWFLKKIEKNFFLEYLIKRKFKKKNGVSLNLKTPTGFNEKIQWIKLHIRDPLLTICADKLLVREYVQRKTNKVYLPKVYAVSDNIDDINLSSLPNSFVIKSNHASGQIIIVKNKQELNHREAIDTMKFWLKENYFLRSGEWCYKDIHPKIYFEELLDEDMIDYKFYCFNGEPKFLYVSKGLGYDHKYGKMVFKWLDWKNTPFQRNDFIYLDEDIKKPKHFEDMVEIARKLSKDFCFCRVDLYDSDKYGVIFSELTFYPSSGFALFYPLEWEKEIGSWLKLPLKE